MANVRPTNKRKTRSGCDGIELAAAFKVLKNFREHINTDEVEEESTSEEGSADVEVDTVALTQIDGLLKWMEHKMQLEVVCYEWHTIYD